MTKMDKQSLMLMVQRLLHAEQNRLLAVRGLIRRTEEGIVGTATPIRSLDMTKEDWTYIHELTNERDAIYRQIDGKLGELTDQ